jgi:pSer/pThr/pTyr-binding forkhead associated (FHA) protein
MDDAQTLAAPPLPEFYPLRLRLRPSGQTLDLTKPDLLLGRHSEADLRMPLPDVSRHHCRFFYSAAGWEVIDLGSLNGVFVNGARVQRSALHAGDHIHLGGLEMEVEAAVPETDVLRHIADTLAADAPQRKAS